MTHVGFMTIFGLLAASSPGAVASGKTGSAGLDGCNSPTTPRAPRTALKQGATPGDESGLLVSARVIF